MKHLATFLYWLAAVFALALILVSFDYRFGRALFLATSLLPGMFCAKFFLPMALRAERRRVLAVICVVASTLIIEWMSLLLASFHTTPSENLMRAPFPGLFSNPVFILILLVAIVVPGELLSHYLKKKLSEERYVTFISDRRKVVLPIEAILYVESNDKEVLLHTQEGLTGRGPVFRNGLSGSTIGSSVLSGKTVSRNCSDLASPSLPISRAQPVAEVRPACM